MYNLTTTPPSIPLSTRVTGNWGLFDRGLHLMDGESSRAGRANMGHKTPHIAANLGDMGVVRTSIQRLHLKHPFSPYDCNPYKDINMSWEQHPTTQN